MTWPNSRPAELQPRLTADGSFSLWSEAFQEGFHCGRGALGEAQHTFLAPAGIELVAKDRSLRVLEVCVGTGTNTAALLEQLSDLGRGMQWWGLELDRRPLTMALAEVSFRSQWRASSLAVLEQLEQQGHWQNNQSQGQLLWGDARERLRQLLPALRGSLDLVLHDAFSPGVCPQLWTMEFLGQLASLLGPRGRLVSYCSAAAVRQALRLHGLQLASIQPGPGAPAHQWSNGTVASAAALGDNQQFAALSEMEEEHLKTRAAEPYRDPSGRADAETIRAERRQAQARSTASSTNGWRKRWQERVSCRNPR